MSQSEASLRLVTKAGIHEDLRQLGVEAGDTLIVHTALSEMGWVVGGAPAVVDALMDAVTADGTVVMPTMSKQCADPNHWPHEEFREHREALLEGIRPYRPEITPTKGMGAVAECFRTYPDTVRSRHPDVSFAAWGADAEFVVSDHEYAFGLGRNSPLERVYELDGRVLLVGLDHHDCNTSLHLAQYVADYEKPVVDDGGAIVEDGEKTWITYRDYDRHDDSWIDDTREIGIAFDHEIGSETGRVGHADSKLMSQPRLVGFAVDWFEAHK